MLLGNKLLLITMLISSNSQNVNIRDALISKTVSYVAKLTI